MRNNKAMKTIINIIILMLIVTTGIAFAIYSYTKAGDSNSKLIAGDIYMKYNNGEEKTVSMVPSETYREGEYYEFTISGKNTSSKNLIYNIVINHGENYNNPYTRINDKYLRFRLVTVNNNVETEVVKEVAYESINNTTIYVDTIDGGTNIDTDITYRLYTWVNGVIVGNVTGAEYTESEWSNVYTNIRVTVNGDFGEKEKENSVLVTFDANGGVVNPKNKFYENGDTYGTLPTPVKTGYNFQGWYEENTYETEVTSSSEIESENNITLYAKYEVDAISNVSFTANPTAINTSGTSNITLTYNGTAKTIAYSTNNTRIATVSRNGVITGISPGRATITATITDYNNQVTTSTVNITVKVLAEKVGYEPPEGVTCNGEECDDVQSMLDKIAEMLD